MRSAMLESSAARSASPELKPEVEVTLSLRRRRPPEPGLALVPDPVPSKRKGPRFRTFSEVTLDHVDKWKTLARVMWSFKFKPCSAGPEPTVSLAFFQDIRGRLAFVWRSLRLSLTPKQGPVTEPVRVKVCEMLDDGNFPDIFGRPGRAFENRFLADAEVAHLWMHHREQFHPDGYTFILSKKGDEFLIIKVYQEPKGRGIEYYSPRFPGKWIAHLRPRFMMKA